LVLEEIVSPVITVESAGKDRIRLTKSIVLALRTLMKQADLNDTTRDLAAFIALALGEVANTIDISVVAWEKRGYWVKAERFRMEWEWTRSIGMEMSKAVMAEDWGSVARLAALIGQRLTKIEVAEKNRLGTPWIGAYQALKKSVSKKTPGK
jgi:hypothetical protein